MKTIIISCFFMLSGVFTDYAQGVLPIVNNKVNYTSVIEDSGLTQAVLFSNALKWFANYYSDSKDVIQFSDKDNGQIIGKGSFKVNYFVRNPIINYTITISVKDGKYRYEITEFSYSDIKEDAFNIEDFPKSWGAKKSLYKKINDQVQGIIYSLGNAMTEKTNDSW